MDIIVFNKKKGRIRNLRIPLGVVAVGFSLIVVSFAADTYFVARYFDGDLLEEQVVDSWRARIADHQRDVEKLSARAKAEMTAVGRRLAAMEARLLRMEALGERVSEVAKLTDGEFRFDQPAPVGGPESALAEPIIVSDYLAAIGKLSLSLKTRERELEVLETLLQSNLFHDEVAPSGRPINSGWMSSPYGKRVDPISGEPAWHQGVDFAGKPGSDVIAVASGVVVFAGRRSGYGSMIEVNHGDGYATRYGHQEALLVDVGNIVKKGDVIGRMGSTGRSTGPHVHFELLQNGRPINPAKYVARRR